MALDRYSSYGRTGSRHFSGSSISTAAEVLANLRLENVKGCLTGGLTVSARYDPRYTLVVDLAVVISTDAQAESIVHTLRRGDDERWVLLSRKVSVAPSRETDAADLRNLAAVATEDEWRLASGAIQLTQERHYARGRKLDTDLRIE